MTGPRDTASVVIPAHNEARVIGRTLTGILADAAPGEFEVIVVCNACADDTAAVALSHGVRVVEIDQRSKVAALNAGDDAARLFPRVYLDADVEINTQALRAVVTAIRNGALAAAPIPLVDTRGCSMVSRGYFAIWSRLGYATSSTLGSGFYGLSEAGRARFGRFPNLIADDGFVYCMFAAHERINPEGTMFTIRAPRTLRALARRRVRITAGNLELSALAGRIPQPPAPTWLDVARDDPRLLPAAAIYVAVNAYAKLAARHRVRSGTAGQWGKDHTTREGGS